MLRSNVGFESLQFMFKCIRIMIACLSFLLDYEKFEDDDSDASSSEDEGPHTSQVVLNRESIYKVSLELLLESYFKTNLFNPDFVS